MTLAPPHTSEEARPRGLGYGVRLGNTWYRLATNDEAPITITTRDQLAERTATGTNAFENMLKTGFAWVRADYTGGEGLDRYPRTPPGPLDDTRYWASRNVDLRRPEPGRPYQVTLAQRFDDWYAAPSEIIEVRSTVERLYVAYESTIATFNDDSDPSPDAFFAGFSANITSFDVSDANEGIALCDDGTVWHKPIDTDTWTEVTTIGDELDNVRAVWMVKGRVILWRGDTADAAPSELVELGLGVSGDPETPSYEVSEVVVDTFTADVLAVEDAGMCILGLTSDRVIRSYVPRSDNAGEPPILTLMSSTPMPKGEQPIAVAYNSGRLIILSLHEDTMRAYSGSMLDERFNFIVGDLTQLREWRQTTIVATPMVRHIAATRDEFLWLVSTLAEGTDLWRYDSVTTGVHRHVQVSEDGRDGLVAWGDRQYVFQRGEVELARTSVFYIEEGWLITPLVNFNLNTDINFTELTLQAFELLGGGGVQVQVAISPDDEALLDPNHPSWRVVAQLVSPTVDALEVPLASETWPKLALRLVLRCHPNGTGAPRLTQLGMRGIPAAQEVIADIPVSVADQVEAPGRMPVRIPGWGDVLFSSLMTLRGRALDIQLVTPAVRMRGMILSVGTPVTVVTDRGSVGRYSMVTFLGDTLTDGSSELSFGGEGIGVSIIGLGLLGVGEI